jgi:hypothetical protein
MEALKTIAQACGWLGPFLDPKVETAPVRVYRGANPHDNCLVGELIIDDELYDRFIKRLKDPTFGL